MKKNRRVIIIKILMFICLIGIIIATINIGIWYVENKNNSDIQKELEHEIIINENNLDDEYQIDFAELKARNSDTVAYLKVNNTNINYIVVKGKDNSYYLNHNFNKDNNRAGWIFMDYRNKLNGTDRNIIIYGHNTLDGTMFGTLKRVITKDWYKNKDNHEIILVTENGQKKYQVFSTYTVNKEDYYITTNFKDDSTFLKFVNTLKKRSVYDYHVDILSSDSILTLSTCTSSDRNRRMVLHAKLLEKIS